MARAQSDSIASPPKALIRSQNASRCTDRISRRGRRIADKFDVHVRNGHPRKTLRRFVPHCVASGTKCLPERLPYAATREAQLHSLQLQFN